MLDNPDWFFYHRIQKFTEVFYVGAPDAEQIVASADGADTTKGELIRYVDRIMITRNPAILLDGSHAGDAPPPKANPHICSKLYDRVDLVASCQRHTCCSAAYCFHTRDGQQKCRFGYPKPLQPETTLVIEDGEPELLTAYNDVLVNSFNPVQLSAWCANVHMKYCSHAILCFSPQGH